MLHIPPKHFRQFDLTPDDLIQATVVFSLLIIFTFILGLIQFADERRRLSWFISLLGSSSMTVLGSIYLVHLYPRYPGMFSMDLSMDSSLFLAADNFAAYVCLWFALINIFDLVLGAVFYRQYLDVLTALIHHPIFIWVMYSCCTGRVPSFSAEGAVGPPYARLFLLMAIEEVPTFLLALGAVFPSCRSDLGFGLSFFFLRLVYHVYFFIYAVRISVPPVAIVLLVLTTLLHAFWFKNWVVKHGRRAFFGSKGDKKKST
jgi:lysylphosphatidylglycerol synthetase-like protein (DUF2156 family)